MKHLFKLDSVDTLYIKFIRTSLNIFLQKITRSYFKLRFYVVIKVI